MDSHVKEFYLPYSQDPTNGHFHSVIPLHGNPSILWEEVQEKVPHLCKGWYELAQLSTLDRIEFSRAYWLAKLPYNPIVAKGIERFFSSLDDIGIFMLQKQYGEPYCVHFVYSLQNNGGFYHGEMAAEEGAIVRLQESFPSLLLPVDYLAFLRIHNGFSKLTDTGVIPVDQVEASYTSFQACLSEAEMVITTKGDPVDATCLIPFYESFGRPLFQCFYGGWYPEQEMGNVYFSGVTFTVSDYTSDDPMEESLAFPTFLDWLVFYLEKVDEG